MKRQLKMGVAVLVCIVRIVLVHLVKFCWACAWLISSLMSHIVSSSESATSNFCLLGALALVFGAGGDVAAGGQAEAGEGAGGGFLGVFGAAFDAGGVWDLAGEGAGDGLLGGGAGGNIAVALSCCSYMNISLSHWNFSIPKIRSAWASGAF